MKKREDFSHYFGARLAEQLINQLGYSFENIIWYHLTKKLWYYNLKSQIQDQIKKNDHEET